MEKRKHPVSFYLYRAVQLLHILVALYITLQGGEWLPMGLVALLFLLVPYVVQKLFRLKLTYGQQAWILFLCTLSYSLGTVIRFYDMFPGFDKMLHFGSGILFTLLGACLYASLSGDFTLDSRLWLRLLFGLGFSMFIAVFWELLEYGRFLVTGLDAQYVVTTGVGDTMGDMFACLLGSLLLLLDGLWWTRKGWSPLCPSIAAYDRLNAPDTTDAPA